MSRNIVITGTNRGIGLEFCRQYLDNGDHVTATVRGSSVSDELERLQQQFPDTLHIITADVTHPEHLHELARNLKHSTIDILINNAGIYGERQPFGEVDADEWLRVLQTNTIAPLMVTQSLSQQLVAGSKVILISSKVGSVADNTSGGSYIYRSSKSAVNMVGKSLSLDLADRGILVGICHPGWVLTDMGGPNALINTQTSVTGLRDVIEKLTPENSGQFFNYDGSIIPW